MDTCFFSSSDNLILSTCDNLKEFLCLPISLSTLSNPDNLSVCLSLCLFVFLSLPLSSPDYLNLPSCVPTI